MKFKLSHYILPSVISMVLVGTYTNIDGLFIGKVAGDAGLAAINIAWPIVALITAIGTGVGIGGSVIVNSLRGEGKNLQAEQAKKMTLLLLFLIGGAFSLLLPFFSDSILNGINALMKADGEVMQYAKEYSFIIAIGGLFQIVGAGIVVLLRNEGKTVLSMMYTIAGLLFHVLLDFLFVAKLALYGVAIATVASQALIMGLGMYSFRIQKGTEKGFVYWKEIMKSSLAPLGLNFVPSAVLFFTNIFAQSAGGTEGVAAYTVMSYAVYTYDYIFQGVCDGAQPIFSYANGANDKGLQKKTTKSVLLILLISSLSFSLITPIMIKVLPMCFSVSAEAERMMASGLIIYAFAYPFKAGIKYICSYAYSSQKTGLSNCITYVDPVLITPLCLLLFSKWWGMNGVWLSLPISQIVVALFGFFMLTRSIKKKAK